MDLLKREMEKKRTAVELAKSSSGPITAKRTYFKVSDMKRVEEELKEKEEAEKKKRSKTASDDTGINHYERANSATSKTNSRMNHHRETTEKNRGSIITDSNSNSTDENITSEDITLALRELGLPIWIFGEQSDKQRRQRLMDAREEQRAAQAGMSEHDDFKLANDGHNIPNPFIGKKHNEMEEDFPKRKDGTKHQETLKNTDEYDPDDEHKNVYKFLKTQLQLWEDDLVQRPETFKVTLAGKNETKTLKQVRDYIKPLFKQLKNRTLDENILKNLVKVVKYCQEGEFVKANDAYIDIAIGRAAWPIGVTMVGIHARSGRAKIESSNVAHVMNSEGQRKYLTSVKRLMTYCQKKSDAAPSKRVSNL